MTLRGRVAVVTGASRGVGRGIARGLGESGATVYVTGRTAGTIESAAREVDAIGGHGIPVRCDHGVDSEIGALFARIERESGRLDLLVNNVHSGVGDIADSVEKRFFELDPNYWDRMNHVGLRAHYVASVHAARIMLKRSAGLIVNVSSFGSLAYLFNTAYGVGKAALDRLTMDTAIELRAEGIAVVSLWPGFVRTELTSALMEEATPGYRRILDAFSETPLISGRAVAAMAADPEILRFTGTVQIAAEVARRNGLREEDGKLPSSPRSFRRLAKALLPGKWQRCAAFVPPGNVPLFMIAPVLTRFSEVLKKNGGYRRAAGGKV